MKSTLTHLTALALVAALAPPPAARVKASRRRLLARSRSR